MKNDLAVSCFSFNELFALFTKVSQHEFELPRALGEGKVKVYHLEKGLQVRFWDVSFTKQLELNNKAGFTNEEAYYTLAFFLNTQGLCFSYGGRLLPQNAIWDTLFLSSTADHTMQIAPQAKGHCLGISFSKNWLKNNVFENKDCFNSLEEKINGIGSLCYHESMSSNSKKQVQELMQKIWENQRGAFYIKAGVLNILSDFFSRLREVNVQSNKQSVHEVICDLEKCLIGNVTGSLPNVKQLASNHSTSPSTLSRHFKKKHGVNISTYFMRKKREYVNQLMQGETKNTKEVAAKVGYYNVNSFKTTFQKHLPDKRA